MDGNLRVGWSIEQLTLLINVSVCIKKYGNQSDKGGLPPPNPLPTCHCIKGAGANLKDMTIYRYQALARTIIEDLKSWYLWQQLISIQRDVSVWIYSNLCKSKIFIRASSQWGEGRDLKFSIHKPIPKGDMCRDMPGDYFAENKILIY